MVPFELSPHEIIYENITTDLGVIKYGWVLAYRARDYYENILLCVAYVVRALSRKARTSSENDVLRSCLAWVRCNLRGRFRFGKNVT